MSVGNGTPFLGYDSYVGVSEETTYSTVATSTSFSEFTSEAFMKEEEELRLEEINTTRDYTRRLKGNITVSGSFESLLNVAEDFHVKCMKQAMGGTVASATIGAAGVYTHTLNVGNMEDNKSTNGADDMKGLTFTIRRGIENGNKFQYRGCRVNTMTIKGEVGTPITVTYEIMGSGGTICTDTLTSSFSEIDPLNFTGVTFKTGATISALGTEYITGFEFSLANNLMEQRNLGSASIYALPPGRRDVKLKLNQQFDTLTAYNRFIQNTKTAVQIILDSGVTIGAAGSSTYSMAINIPCVYWNNVTPQVGGIEALSQEIDGSAIVDTSSSYICQLTVNNATEDY
jgi:hypothetical protein